MQKTRHDCKSDWMSTAGLYRMHVKSSHSTTCPEIWTFSDRFFVPISHSKSRVLYCPSASPFSDIYLFIHRDTEFSRLKLSISNLLFLRVLFNPSVACDRFWHVFCIDPYWIVHNFVRIHFTTRQVPAVALSVLDYGLSLNEIFFIPILRTFFKRKGLTNKTTNWLNSGH